MRNISLWEKPSPLAAGLRLSSAARCWRGPTLENLQHMCSPKLLVFTYYIYLKYTNRQVWASSVDPDQTPLNVASDQGLHFLPLILEFLYTSTSGNAPVISGPGTYRAGEKWGFNFSVIKVLLNALHCRDKFMVKSLLNDRPPQSQFLFPGIVCSLLQKSICISFMVYSIQLNSKVKYIIGPMS